MVAFLVGSAQMRQAVNFPMAQTLEHFPDQGAPNCQIGYPFFFKRLRPIP